MFTQFISFIVPVILVPYTSRTLGVDNIGIYSYMFSIVTIFSSIGRLGLNTYGQLLVSKNRDNKDKLSDIVSELIKLRFISSALILVLYIDFIYLFNENMEVGFLLIIYLIADAFDILWLFQGLEMFKYIALRTLLLRTLNLLLVIVFIHGDQDLYFYVIIMQVTVLVTNILLWSNVRKYVNKLHIIHAKSLKHLKYCLIYLVPTIANLVYNMLDKTMLGYIGKSTYESGCYEQAYKIITIAQTILLAIASTALPQLTYLHNNNQQNKFNNLIRTSMQVLNMLIYPMAAGLFINADLIVNVVLGTSFEGSVRILQCLSILLIFATFNYNIGNEVLISTGTQKLYNVGVICGSIINLCCNLFLIPKFAGIGAAYGSLAAELIIFMIFILFSSKIIPLSNIFNITSLKYILVTILMSIVNIFLSKILIRINIVIKLIIIISICTVVYFGLLLILKNKLLVDQIKKCRYKK